eukprot:GILJ01008909.1.p1 GENE.GILJ01008909.1~~GILJ01008909.1.p1  ORF type:complete len:375 (+),score=46.37 GILJ01008909.1:274-1398(+)
MVKRRRKITPQTDRSLHTKAVSGKSGSEFKLDMQSTLTNKRRKLTHGADSNVLLDDSTSMSVVMSLLGQCLAYTDRETQEDLAKLLSHKVTSIERLRQLQPVSFSRLGLSLLVEQELRRLRDGVSCFLPEQYLLPSSPSDNDDWQHKDPITWSVQDTLCWLAHLVQTKPYPCLLRLDPSWFCVAGVDLCSFSEDQMRILARDALAGTVIFNSLCSLRPPAPSYSTAMYTDDCSLSTVSNASTMSYLSSPNMSRSLSSCPSSPPYLSSSSSDVISPPSPSSSSPAMESELNKPPFLPVNLESSHVTAAAAASSSFLPAISRPGVHYLNSHSAPSPIKVKKEQSGVGRTTKKYLIRWLTKISLDSMLDLVCKFYGA